MLSGSRLKGLTTASGLWVTAGLGMGLVLGCMGFRLSLTVLVLLVLNFWIYYRKTTLKISEKNDHTDQES